MLAQEFGEKLVELFIEMAIEYKHQKDKKDPRLAREFFSRAKKISRDFGVPDEVAENVTTEVLRRIFDELRYGYDDSFIVETPQ